MSSPAGSTAAARKALRRFRRNRRGSAAVEFALVAPVFFALLFAIIETAIVFFAGQVLETVTQDSALAPIFDPRTRAFRHGGIRNLPVAMFQLKLRRALEQKN